MEQGKNWNIPVTNHHSDQTIESSSLDDITIRRMKNRERQRRYRLRKRLEADTIKETIYSPLNPHEGYANNMQMLVPITQQVCHASSNGINASAEGQLVLARIELPMAEATASVETRVHCHRDWKRDARRAHCDGKNNGDVNQERALVSGSKMRSLSSLIKDDMTLDTYIQSNGSISDITEMQKTGPGRRHWKVEARNRKS